jgi:hypothetical protein
MEAIFRVKLTLDIPESKIAHSHSELLVDMREQ